MTATASRNVFSETKFSLSYLIALFLSGTQTEHHAVPSLWRTTMIERPYSGPAWIIMSPKSDGSTSYR